MRAAKILFKNEEAGILTQDDKGSFIFRYNEQWLANSKKHSISLTLPKNEVEFHSKILFPFFFNMLPEGSNKQVVCKLNRIDPDDYFGLLMTTATHDTIGAVSIIKIEN